MARNSVARNSVAELVSTFASLGDEVAYVFPRGYRTHRWTYGRLARVARQFAHELRSRGVQKGDRVVLWGDNSGEWVAAFFGAALYGAAIVPLDRASTPDFAERIRQQVSAAVIVASRELASSVNATGVMVLEDLEDSVALHPADFAPAELTRSDVLEVIFTSGTTADPKGVVITHGNVLANLEPLEREIDKYKKYEKLVHPLRFLDLLPLSHVFGQFLGLFVPQALGATVVFQSSLNPAEVIAAIHREKVNVCIAVPRMMESLKQHIEREAEQRGELEQLRKALADADGQHFTRRWWRFRREHNRFGWRFWAFVSGGSALDEDVEKFWSRMAFAIIQGYGLTETTSLVSVNHPFRASKRSIGKLLPGREVKLAPDGEILVRGENVASRYWASNEIREDAAAADADEQGWFHTGDLGAFDAEGNLYFKGRKKTVIVTPAGMNVYPEDLEEAVRYQPGVRDVVVVGVPVGGNAEPCAVVIMEPGHSAQDAVNAANTRLAEFQQIHRIVEWPEPDFPRTSTQKPKINVIEEFVRSSAKVSTGGVGDLVARVAAAGAPSSTTAADTHLQLTSMERVELMAALETRYQVDLSEARFSEARTVSDLQNLLRESDAGADRYSYPVWPQRWPFTWIRVAIYWLLAWPATMLLAKPKVIGGENLREVRSPVLIVSNHVTLADIGFVLAAVPRRMRGWIAPAMLGELLHSMQHPPTTENAFTRLLWRVEYYLLTALFAVFPLPQKSGFRRSFAFAGESIDRGFSVLVFPEGRRTQTGKLDAFQSGVGMLANRLNVPIVPIRIDGLHEAAQRGWWIVKPNRIVVRVGKPVTYPPNENPTSIARDLERRVREL